MKVKKSPRHKSSTEENLGRGEGEKRGEKVGLSWGDRGNMSGGKPVEVVSINFARAATSWSEVQMGESASSESSLGRYSSFWRERDLQ